MNKRIVAGAIVIGAALTMSVACSAAKDQDPTPVKQFKITPAAGARTAAPSAAATAPGTPAASPVTSTPAAQATGTPGTATSGGGGGTVSIVASNILFDKTKLTASAGSVTIQFENKDGGIPHNFNVFDGKDATAKSLGSTPIVAGPTKQELKVDLKAGSYYFQCDVHPTTMTGTLTVS